MVDDRQKVDSGDVLGTTMPLILDFYRRGLIFDRRAGRKRERRSGWIAERNKIAR